jgi:hypothetical protein
MPLKRPFGVTLLLWMVLSLSAWGAVRFAASLRWWDVLSEFESRLSPVYLSITGAGWALAGGVLIWGALTRKKWTYPAIPVFFAGWLSMYWVERIFFQSTRANLPFAVIVSIVFLAVTLFCALHGSTKKFLTRSEEYGQQYQRSTPE